MAERFEITDEMRATVGKQWPPWTYELTTTNVRAYARGVGYTDPVYFDVEAARRAGYSSLPAPPTFLGTPVFVPGESSDTFSTAMKSQPSVNHGLPGLLDGGTDTEYFDQLCAGDTLTAVSTLTALDVRESKALGKMLIVSGETRFTNQATGKIVAVQRSQAIFY